MTPRRPSVRSRRHTLAGSVLVTAAALSVAASAAPAAASGELDFRFSKAPATAEAVAMRMREPAIALHRVVPLAPPAPAPVVVAAAPAPPAPAPPPPPPAPRPVVAPPPPPAPVSYHWRLTGPNGLNTGVGFYSDCSGRTALTHSIAAIDTCVGGRTFFVGHNPGVFTPLMYTGVGAIIIYWDGNGVPHALRVFAVRTWIHSGFPSMLAGATAEFQTCITADGSVDRILDAAPA